MKAYVDRRQSCRALSRTVTTDANTLVEQTEAHVIVLRLLLLLFLGLLLGSRLVGGGSGGRASRRSVLVGVGDAVLELRDLVPLEVGLDGDSEYLLVGVDDGVHDGRQRGEVGSQRDTGDGGDGAAEGLEELGLLDVQDGGIEGLAVVVDLGDTHAVGEGRDVQQVEKGGLGGTDLVTSLDELQIGSNFDGTTGNLGGDTESLEERGLSGLHTTASCQS